MNHDTYHAGIHVCIRCIPFIGRWDSLFCTGDRGLTPLEFRTYDVTAPDTCAFADFRVRTCWNHFLQLSEAG